MIQRNILENPGWYTQYTPYQAEISQGRLEALLNFQTMVTDLTALPLANASLLDEATAAAEAMAMCHSIAAITSEKTFLRRAMIVIRRRSRWCRRGRSRWGSRSRSSRSQSQNRRSQIAKFCGVLVQYPTTDGRIVDYTDIVEAAHAAGALVVFATDLLA